MWAFVGAGLLRREKRYVLLYLPFSLVMFVAGMLFAYFVALPVAMLYLLTLDASVGYLLNYLPYFKLIVSILAIFGLLFQLPLVMMVLVRLGMVEVRTFSHYRRHAIVPRLRRRRAAGALSGAVQPVPARDTDVRALRVRHPALPGWPKNARRAADAA